MPGMTPVESTDCTDPSTVFAIANTQVTSSIGICTENPVEFSEVRMLGSQLQQMCQIR